MNGFRVVSFAFGLSMATAVLVLPLMAFVGRTMDGPIANVVVAVAAAVAVLSADVEVETSEIWTFGLATFLLGAGVHVLAGTGANSGNASPLLVVAVWFASVLVAGAVVFRA